MNPSTPSDRDPTGSQEEAAYQKLDVIRGKEEADRRDLRRQYRGRIMPIHPVRWRLVIVGFLVLAASVAYALYLVDRNSGRDLVRAQELSAESDFHACESGNETRQKLVELLRFIGDRIGTPDSREEIDVLIHDAEKEVLGQRDCDRQYAKDLAEIQGR